MILITRPILPCVESSFLFFFIFQLELVKQSASSDPRLLQMNRDALELACFLSLYAHDVKTFARYIAQVKVYYNDYQSILPPSQLQGPVLGLYLLYLLSQNQIADFHTEYELLCHSAGASSRTGHTGGSGPIVPPSPTASSLVAQNALLSSPFIRFPIQLEAQLMEGCYNQILTAKAAVPLPLYNIFMETLSDTVHNKIADCAELAYTDLSLAEVQKLLMLNSSEETQKFVSTRPQWTVKDGQVAFNQQTESKVEIPALKIIKQTLDYATELERIV